MVAPREAVLDGGRSAPNREPLRASPDAHSRQHPAARRAERGIALVTAVMRVVVLVQILVSAPSGLRLSNRPAAYLALTMLVVMVSPVLIVQCVARASVRAGWWQLPDLALAWVALPAMYLLLPSAQAVGTWESWAVAYAINVAALAAAWMPPRLTVLASATMGAWSFVWTSAAHQTSWETNVNNALTIPGYAVVVALLVFYIRALAADADQSREDAVAATRALELERYQLAVHDATSILRMLSDEGTPDDVLPGLRRQADREARRLRSYLAGPASLTSCDPRPTTIETMLTTALEGFDDLPLELAIELGAEVALDEDVWAVTSRAVTTILHNVRIHAEARQVVVHADTDGRTWEVVVSDDGVGFDQASQPLGFGLHIQVCQALAELGVTVRIRSALGLGTSVTIIGAAAKRAGRRRGAAPTRASRSRRPHPR